MNASSVLKKIIVKVTLSFYSHPSLVLGPINKTQGRGGAGAEAWIEEKLE